MPSDWLPAVEIAPLDWPTVTAPAVPPSPPPPPIEAVSAKLVEALPPME